MMVKTAWERELTAFMLVDATVLHREIERADKMHYISKLISAPLR